MGAPSIKVKRWTFLKNKISLTGCKWSNLSAPGTETDKSLSLSGDFLFPKFCPCCLLSSSLWGNKKWKPPLHCKGKNGGKFWNKISLTGCKWSNLSAPGETELIADSIPRPLNHGILLPRLPRKGKHDATTAAAPVRHAAVDADG